MVNINVGVGNCIVNFSEHEYLLQLWAVAFLEKLSLHPALQLTDGETEWYLSKLLFSGNAEAALSEQEAFFLKKKPWSFVIVNFNLIYLLFICLLFFMEKREKEGMELVGWRGWESGRSCGRGCHYQNILHGKNICNKNKNKDSLTGARGFVWKERY